MNADPESTDLSEMKVVMPLEENDTAAIEQQPVLVDAGLTDTAFPQIVVNRMPRHSKKKDFEKFLATKALNYRKLKVVPNKDFSFITFDNDVDCQTAITALQGTEFKKSILEITTRTHNTSNDNGKRPAGDNADGDDDDDCADDRREKRSRPDSGAEATIKTARDAVSPWWDVPYEEQLVRKTKAMVKDCLNKSFREVKDTYIKWNRQAKYDGRPATAVPAWITETKNNELTWIDYRPIIASPEPCGYRNKCEFTFGVDSLDRQPGLGFRVSAFSQGVLVGSPQDCPNISNPMKILVTAVNTYLRETSSLKVYDMHAHTGVWRLLTVRYSKRTRQMILMLVVSLKAVEAEAWALELASLTACVQGILRTADIDCEVAVEGSSGDGSADSVACDGTPLVTGLCYQVYDGLSVPSADHPAISVFGEMTIVENMNGCSFRVSPQAFFQVNTPCAELLYSDVMAAMRETKEPPAKEEGAEQAPAAVAAAATTAEPDNSDLLCLDVCSGTGTIGICCAKASMGHVIGVELCQAAVNDAIDNATLNGLTLFTNKEASASSVVDTPAGEGEGESRVNKYECGFICSRAEAVLESLIGNKKAPPGGVDLRPFQNMARGKKVLAVVDPPREGLHVDCLRAIRNCSRIDRLVYVSCNPTKSLPKDLAMLCGPSNKKLFGQAFRPVRATPVDLFPHTPHCEMLLVLERC